LRLYLITSGIAQVRLFAQRNRQNFFNNVTELA
jgi:hypothetical protein